MKWYLIIGFLLLSCGKPEHHFVGSMHKQVNNSDSDKEDSNIPGRLEKPTLGAPIDEKLETDEEEVKAEIPVIISGSYLNCNTSTANKKIMECRYIDKLKPKLTPEAILRSTDRQLIAIVLEVDRNKREISMIFSQEIKPSLAQQGQQFMIMLEPDHDHAEEITAQGNKQLTKAMEYHDLTFTPDLAYLDFPRYDFESSSGFFNESDLLAFLINGRAAISCYENVSQALLYASDDIILRREPDFAMMNLAPINFNTGLNSIKFTDISNTYCEVMLKFPINIESIGIYLERYENEELVYI